MTGASVLLATAAKRLAWGASVLEPLVHGVHDARARWKPEPSQWSILEVVCHLGDEEVEDFRRRLHVERPRLRAPWTVSGHAHLFLHGDGAVLMPLRTPVRFSRFVEECRFDGDEIATDHGPQIAAQPLVHQQPGHSGVLDEVTHSAAAGSYARKGRRDVLALLIGENEVGEGVSGSIQVMHPWIVTRNRRFPLACITRTDSAGPVPVRQVCRTATVWLG